MRAMSNDRGCHQAPSSDQEWNEARIRAWKQEVCSQGETDPMARMSSKERLEFDLADARRKVAGYGAMLAVAKENDLTEEVARLQELYDEWDGRTDWYGDSLIELKQRESLEAELGGARADGIPNHDAEDRGRS
jgi:hypothetical protein